MDKLWKIRAKKTMSWSKPTGFLSFKDKKFEIVKGMEVEVILPSYQKPNADHIAEAFNSKYGFELRGSNLNGKDFDIIEM